MHVMLLYLEAIASYSPIGLNMLDLAVHTQIQLYLYIYIYIYIYILIFIYLYIYI